MDPLKNPYASGLSVPPPALPGREAVLAHARLFFGRVKARRGEKSLLLNGLRGSGKTVLLRALALLAQAEGVALESIDDAETLPPAELVAKVRQQERHLLEATPQAIVLAGLDVLPLLDDATHALALRLFQVFELGALDAAACEAAFKLPALAQGSEVSADAIAEMIRVCKGHPAFLQAWAYEAWNHARGPAIQRNDLRAVTEAVEARLDRDFYGPGFERLSPREKAYLRTMAHLGPGPHRSGDIADSMDAKITSLGPLRAKLLAKGWVYSPEHGLLGFSSPGFDEYMRRVMPGFR